MRYGKRFWKIWIIIELSCFKIRLHYLLICVCKVQFQSKSKFYWWWLVNRCWVMPPNALWKTKVLCPVPSRRGLQAYIYKIYKFYINPSCFLGIGQRSWLALESIPLKWIVNVRYKLWSLHLNSEHIYVFYFIIL